MYVRDTDIIVLRPGKRGSEHASERFAQGGTSEGDLLPQNDEINLYRVIVPAVMPDTILQGIIGIPLRQVIEIPPYRGNCSLRGCDLGGDTLNLIADHDVCGARHVERGTLISIEALPRQPAMD